MLIKICCRVQQLPGLTSQNMLIEVTARQDDGSSECPHIQDHTKPGGCHFDPHWCHVGIEGSKIRAWAEMKHKSEFGQYRIQHYLHKWPPHFMSNVKPHFLNSPLPFPSLDFTHTWGKCVHRLKLVQSICLKTWIINKSTYKLVGSDAW